MVADPKLYDDSLKAGKIVKERSMVEAKLNTVERLTSELQSWKEMHGNTRPTYHAVDDSKAFDDGLYVTLSSCMHISAPRAATPSLTPSVGRRSVSCFDDGHDSSRACAIFEAGSYPLRTTKIVYTRTY